MHTKQVVTLGLLAAPFALLPLFPEGFAIYTAVVGIYAIRHGKTVWWPWFLVFGILGAIGQLFAPQNIISAVDSQSRSTNLLSLSSLNTLQGWHFGAIPGGSATYTGQGFWRMPRFDLRTGQEYAEIATYEIVPIVPAHTYTLSFYFRSDGKHPKFMINFISMAQYNPVQPKIVGISSGLWRAYASYTTKLNETELRGVNLLGFSGDWTYLELGYPQLEPGSQVSLYSPKPLSISTPGLRLIWWLGTALLGLLLVSGSQLLLEWVGGTRAGIAIWIGLLIHLVYAYFIVISDHNSFGDRATGFTPHPNFLGHWAVIVGVLIWLLTDSRLGLLALATSLVGVWLTASRAAGLGGVVFMVAWWIHLRPRLRIVVLSGGILLGLALLFSGKLDRLRWDTIFTGQYISNQSRLQTWQVARQAFLEHPVTGVGWGRFSEYHYTHAPAGTLEPSIHAHNLFLTLAAEAGLLGLLGFGLLIGVIVWRLVQWRAYSVVVLLGIALFLNLLDYTFFTAAVFGSLMVGVAWASNIASGRMMR